MMPLGRITFLCATLLATVACGKAAETDVLERVQRDGKIRIGYANEAPFAFRDPTTGKLTGEAPEVARRAMSNLGIRDVEGVLTEFGALIPGLKAGRFDLIAAGMYITPERCRQVLFSEPSYCVHEALMVPRDNPRDLHSYGDVATKRATLAVVAGTAELGYAKDTGIDDALIRVFPDAPSAMEGVRNGLVDAFAATALTVADLLRKSPNTTLEAADPFYDPVVRGVSKLGCGAFAFRKQDTALRDAFDRELKGVLDNPMHAALVAPFGFGTHTQVAGVTRQSLCESHK